MLRPEDNDCLIDEALAGTRLANTGSTLYQLIDDTLDAFAAAARTARTRDLTIETGDNASNGIRFTVTICAVTP